MVSPIKLAVLGTALALSGGVRLVKEAPDGRDEGTRGGKGMSRSAQPAPYGPIKEKVAVDPADPDEEVAPEPEEVSAMWSQCGVSGASGQIVNGEDAPQCKWRWQVSLQSRGRHFCGGMLIRPDWVLTAAHCLGGSIDVVAGEWKLSRSSGKEQSASVRRAYPHPKYDDDNMDYDIALLKLSKSLRMTSCVGTVCLPTRNVSDGATCWISGWGALKSGSSRTPDILQQGEVKVMSNRDCQRAYDRLNDDITSSMVCANGRTSSGKIVDACQGDSGGPLVCESRGTWTIHGATSWGEGCADRRYPGVWSRVFRSLSWIEGYVGRQ